MITFRIRPQHFRIASDNVLFLIAQPLLALIFLYFLFTSFDLFNLSLLIFKVKFTNAIAALLLLFYLLIFRNLRMPLNFSLLALAILSAMIISASQSPNPYACIGLMLFFIFNYFCYFLIPYNLFKYLKTHTLLNLYFSTFFCIGAYAVCQFAFSIVGIILPGVGQYIFSFS